MRSSLVQMRSSPEWMRSSLVVRASDCQLPMHQLQRSWVRYQHLSGQWNLRGGRWSSVKYSTKKTKNSPKQYWKKNRQRSRSILLSQSRGYTSINRYAYYLTVKNDIDSLISRNKKSPRKHHIPHALRRNYQLESLTIKCPRRQNNTCRNPPQYFQWITKS